MFGHPVWLDLHPTITIIAYLLTGLTIGIAIIKWPGARSESPVGTLALATFAWGPFFMLFAPVILFLGFFGAIVRLLGVEAVQADTHGV